MTTGAQPLRQRIEVLAFWRAQPGAFMLIGRASEALPKAGIARVAGSIGRFGVFRAEFWPSADRNDIIVVAVVRLPDHADPAENAMLAIRGSRAADRDIGLSLQHPRSEAEFGALAAELAGAHAAQVTRFLLDVVRPQDESDARLPHSLLISFLSRGAAAGGCIELLLAVPDRLVMLQGWSTVGEDEIELLLPTSTLPRYSVPVARFARSDVQSPASGLVLAVPPGALAALSDVEIVFVLASTRLLMLRIIDRRLLDPESSIGQLRHLLPRLTCAPEALELFRLAAQPEYQGHDTLINSGRPVRVAVDLALLLEHAGAYLSGWIFDPGGEVAEVRLCWTGSAIRIDQAFVRIAREDVCEAFRNDPQFAPTSDHQPGFAVACNVAPLPLSSTHLRLKFSDGDVCFIPVRFSRTWSQATRRTLLQSVDLHKASGLAIVEQHLSPFLSRIQTLREQPPTPILLGPVERSRAIVVPLRSTTPPRALISSFLHDRLSKDEHIIFVCSPEWTYSHHQTLIELVRFYGLPASILALSHDAQPAGLLAAAASSSEAETFLLLSPNAAGDAPGWREALYKSAQEADVACPTIFYEDRSIRFAGGTAVEFTDRMPYVHAYSHRAGLPRQAVASVGMPRTMEGGSLACCLIRRGVVPMLERTVSFDTGIGQEVGFFLYLRDAGVSRSWIASVSVTVPEDDTDTTPLARLIDGWILRQVWGDVERCAS